MRKGLDEQTVARVLATFKPEEREMIQAMRKQLSENGVTKEPLRTKMACEFASVLLASRKAEAGDSKRGSHG